WDIAIWGTAVELKKPEMLAAADLQTDGAFFGGALVAREVPSAFEEAEIPKYRYHELAVGALRKSLFYVRRLPDDENSWYSGEYEFVSAYPLDVRGAVERLSKAVGAEVMEIDRRFHKRLVKPLDW
ncbi:MAG TPA: hypothetical protein VEJ18_19840, partial [Planctomycetota bacterium]|nr:hypothetical protein [Planctomycetota bacterium]